MVCCAVGNCKNSSGRISKMKDGITFHRFPRDSVRRRKWEAAVKRNSTIFSTVCSEHFAASDFYLTVGGLRKLAIDAVPSINIIKSPDQAPEPTIAQLSPIALEPDDSEEVIQLKYKVRRLEIIAEDRKRRLNLMWQSKRRLRMKLKQMKRLIKHLIKHKNMNQNR